jgi:hypothetical protein
MKSYIYIILFLATLTLNPVMAQHKVGINTTTIDDSAILDITATNKGLLIPNVSLINTINTTTPINTPANGLLIWNTNAGVTNGSGVGFYYFNATRWEKFQRPSTLDLAYDTGGAGNDRLINADSEAVKVLGGDGLYITGTFGSGVDIDSEESGAGTRLFFNPRNAAFKAGGTLGPTFSAIQSRNYSFGVGFDIETRSGRGFAANNTTGTNTQGTNETAFGHLSEGKQNSSFATGSNNISSQNNALVFGNLNNSKGKSSLTSGTGGTAESVGEVVLGTYPKAYARFNQSEDDTVPGNDATDSHNENYQDDRIFVIGNGTSATQNNALEIWKTGVIEVNESYELPTADGLTNYIMQTDGAGVVTWEAQSNVIDPYTHLQMFTSDTPFVMNNTGGNINLPNFDLGVIPTVFNVLGSLEVRFVIFYTDRNGALPTLRVRADNGIINGNILGAGTFTNFPLSGTKGMLDTGWRNWNAGITPYEVRLNGSVGSPGDSLNIQNAYLLIRSR